MRTRKNNGIWAALAFALLLHGLFLLLPLTNTTPIVSDGERIELELIALLPELPPMVEITTEPFPLTEATQSPLPTEKPKQFASPPVPVEPAQRQPVTLTKHKPVDDTAIILSRQFITEETKAERLFGKTLAIDQSVMQREFHFPARPDLLAMLSTPMQDLPFEYTPGLVHFSYAPGVRGDLQRFWDVITPEFGWRTKNGTEFRCVWLLVVAGCGWK